MASHLIMLVINCVDKSVSIVSYCQIRYLALSVIGRRQGYNPIYNQGTREGETRIFTYSDVITLYTDCEYKLILCKEIELSLLYQHLMLRIHHLDTLSS